MTAEIEERKRRLRLFLAELAVLEAEYGMVIGGCGECGSPHVADADGQVGSFLAWTGERYAFRQGSILGGDR